MVELVLRLKDGSRIRVPVDRARIEQFVQPAESLRQLFFGRARLGEYALAFAGVIQKAGRVRGLAALFIGRVLSETACRFGLRPGALRLTQQFDLAL